MKKNWIGPEVLALDVQETYGGPKLNTTPDGEPWQDDNGNWHLPIGENS